MKKPKKILSREEQTLCTARKILLAANRKLKKETWIRGTLRSGNRMCALGAIDAVCGEMTRTTKAVTLLTQAVREITKNSGISIPAFNDRKNLTPNGVKDVKKAFSLARKLADEELKNL